MTQRKYSIEEIDRMRDMLDAIGQTPFADISDRIIEDRLRTYMMNGTAPEELEAVAKEKNPKYFEWRRV